MANAIHRVVSVTAHQVRLSNSVKVVRSKHSLINFFVFFIKVGPVTFAPIVVQLIRMVKIVSKLVSASTVDTVITSLVNVNAPPDLWALSAWIVVPAILLA